jgi:hypothetical protein
MAHPEYVTVFTSWSPWEVELARAMLEQAGVPAWLEGENLSSVLPISAMGGARVLVRVEDAGLAEEVLGEWLGSDWFVDDEDAG